MCRLVTAAVLGLKSNVDEHTHWVDIVTVRTVKSATAHGLKQ